MKRLNLKLPHGNYPILIGSKVIANLPKEISKVSKETTKVFVIADRKLTKWSTALEKTLLKAGLDVHIKKVSADEKIKDFEKLFPLYDWMMKKGGDRKSVLMALGGGAIGDAVGFLAATYMRGIPWIGLPTTLLAQVDSSVGGKTAVNHPNGKNLIGAFHQPSLVVCELDYLKTLPARELLSGYGEIIKYGLIFDKPLFDYCAKNTKLILKGNATALEKVVHKSLSWKVKAVQKDEFDLKGIREALNYGHTFGHALEAELGYGKLRHGEAVIWGMRVATRLSYLKGFLSVKESIGVDQVLSQLQVPKIPKNTPFPKLLKHMKKDKKTQGGQLKFVLLDKIGHSFSQKGILPEEVKEAWESLNS